MPIRAAESIPASARPRSRSPSMPSTLAKLELELARLEVKSKAARRSASESGPRCWRSTASASCSRRSRSPSRSCSTPGSRSCSSRSASSRSPGSWGCWRAPGSRAAARRRGTMATASRNGRTSEVVRREIEVERKELEAAVEQLRDGLGRDRRRRQAAWKAARRRGRRARRGLLPRRRGRRDDALPRPQGPRALSAGVGHMPSSPWRLSAREWAQRLQAGVPVVPGRRRDGHVRPGRLQLTARVLPGDGLPRRPARPDRGLRDAAGVPRPGSARRRAGDDRHAAAGDVEGHVGGRVRRGSRRRRSGPPAAR